MPITARIQTFEIGRCRAKRPKSIRSGIDSEAMKPREKGFAIRSLRRDRDFRRHAAHAVGIEGEGDRFTDEFGRGYGAPQRDFAVL
jgi:hypothetical protein